MPANTLQWWGVACLGVYIAGMLFLGIVGSRKADSGDAFATARHGFGPVFLGIAFAANTASGATFIGAPGIAYEVGISFFWAMWLSPIGIYFGILVCQKAIIDRGQSAQSRSIPEFVGDLYDSDPIRLATAGISLLLIFYMAGQLTAGVVIFQTLLGFDFRSALLLTAITMLVYVALGGAFADILTDGIQGLLMAGIAIITLVLFFYGFGVGGFSNAVQQLQIQDTMLLKPLNRESPLAITNSVWGIVSVAIAQIPLGFLPHIGNKLWALRDRQDRRRFLAVAFAFGMIYPAIVTGGLLARAVIGDDLMDAPTGTNAAIPALFIATMPEYLAAFLGVTILAAVMSTADGLLISLSQVFANDFYRRLRLRRRVSTMSAEKLDRSVLFVSRLSLVVVMAMSVLIAWNLESQNVVLMIWIGIGGLLSALAGPLILGLLWGRVTTAGAVAGLFG